MRSLLFFIKFYTWFSLRNMRKHLGRALTVLLGIALGAAVFTSVRLSINASLDSFARSMDLITGSADRILIRPGGRVPEDLITELLKNSIVDAASPLLTTYVRPATSDAAPFLLIGLDPILDRTIRNWDFDEADRLATDSWFELIREPYTLVITKPLADRYKVARGDYFGIENAHQTVRFKIAGIMAQEGLGLVEGGQVALTDIATFQEFTGLHGVVDRIDLRFKPRAADIGLKEITALLPEDIIIGSPSAAKQSGQGMIRAYQLNLSILSFASLFVGMFLVYSLVALNAASRRHELAVLRSVGATPNLLFFLFLAEGAVLGMFGWLVAIPISTFLVKYLLGGVSQTISTLFVRVQVDQLSLNWWEFALSFGITVMVSMLAALQPAREAMQVSPKEALEISDHGMQVNKSPRRFALIGLISLALVYPFSRLPGVLNIPVPGYLAILLLFIGFSLLAPWCLTNLGNILSPFIRRLAGIPAYLAGRYVKDSGTRTAVSVGALITAVALFASLVIMIHSFRRTVEIWTHQTISGDLFFTTKLNEINQFRNPVPPETAEWFRSLGKDIELVPNRRYFLSYESFPYEFEVLDLKIFFKYGDFFWFKGKPELIRPRLINGEGVIISEVFSNRTGLDIGDTFRARVETSMVELPVLGIVRDYRTQGGVVFYSIQQFKQRYHDSGWGGARIFFQNQSQDLNLAAGKLKSDIIDRWGDKLEMIGGQDLRNSILRVFDETFAITTVLLLIALVIAALGIATTLTVLVLERSRQLNTIFAVGASFGQIRTMIFWEAAFLVVTGETAGIICGFLLSYLLVYVINQQSFGWTFMYSIDWQALVMSLPLIIMTALAAAMPAIRLVFREPPATLLRE